MANDSRSLARRWIGAAVSWKTLVVVVPVAVLVVWLRYHGLVAPERSVLLIGAALIVLVAVGLVAVAHFMAEAARARRALAVSEERFRVLMEHASDAVVVFDPEWNSVYTSPAFGAIFGEDASDLDLGRVHPDDVARVAEVINRDDGFGAEPIWCEIRVRTADASWHSFEVGITDRRNDPAIGGYVANLRDVTERKLFEQELSYRANHDALTRLPNRSQFVERLGRAVERATETQGAVAVLVVDIDRFKVVNDSLGHEVGDRLLTEIAARLRSSLRPGDLVARFGGDEFTVLLEDIHTSADAITVAERILDAFRAPVAIGARELHVSTSVGIAVGGVAATSMEGSDLLREADLAMYLAKERGRGRWELFDAHTAPKVAERLELESGIRRALDRREFVVHFQPEIALDGSGVVALEARARWQHPTRGLLLPGVFVPIAEDSALIIELDQYVMREALRQARLWNLHVSAQPVRASVNVSSRFLREHDVVEHIRDALDETDARPEWLQIEISERTALASDGHAFAALRTLRELGITIVIDHFGTGYSSLACLRQLPADVLKLDQSFVADVADRTAESAIVRAVVTMGHALGVRVAADGVERPDQVRALQSLGCDSGQGQHWSAAVPADAVRALLERLGPLEVAGPTSVAGSHGP